MASGTVPVEGEGAEKMKKMRYLFMLAAVPAFVCLMGGCGDTGLMPTGSEEREKESSIVDLDWYINFSWFTTTWGKSQVSKAVTDITGANIHFLAPKGDESEKLNAMIAADTLPDLVTLEWSASQNSEMIKNGQVYALNELADQYDPGFYDVLDKAVLDWYKQPDGNLYAYYNSFYTPQDYEENDDIPSNQVFLVRKDIYQALGEPDMTTPEGFSEAVKRAAELFPEINGEPLIPIGADEFTDKGNVSFGLYLQSFLAVPYEKDGKYYDRNTDPDYLAWLKVFRELAGEGYLKDEIFVDKRLQLKEKFEKGQYFCLLYQSTDIIDQLRKLEETNPDCVYIAVEGPRNGAGDEPQLPIGGIYGWTATYIPKNCSDPQKALELLKYLISEEGQKMTCLGVEGEMYDMKDGVPAVRPQVKELLSSDRKAYDERYGADNTYWMMQNNMMQMKWKKETDPVIRQLQEWTYPYTAYTSQYSTNFNGDTVLAALEEKQQKIWGDTLPKLLLADSDQEFDRILDEYLKLREENGYGAYAESMTEVYRQNKEKLGFSGD